MPQSKKETVFTPEVPNPFAMGDMDTLSTQQGAVLAEMNGSALKNVAALHHEISGFIDHRLRKDVELQQTLSKCRTAADAFQTCTDYWQDTVREYWQETAKLSDMAMRTHFIGVPGQAEHKQAAV